MNKPFKPEPIVPILADVGVSISDLKKNPAAVVAAARQSQVAILSRNKPVAYVISPEVWEAVLDMHEDALDAELARRRVEDEGDQTISVTLDDLRD